MANYNRKDARDWARQHLVGVANVTLPTMTSDRRGHGSRPSGNRSGRLSLFRVPGRCLSACVDSFRRCSTFPLKWLFDIYTVEQTFPSPLVSVATSAADASGTGSGRVPRRGVGRPRGSGGTGVRLPPPPSRHPGSGRRRPVAQRKSIPFTSGRSQVRLLVGRRWLTPKETRPRAVTPGEAGASPVGHPKFPPRGFSRRPRAVRQPAWSHEPGRRGSAPRRATPAGESRLRPTSRRS